MSLTNNLNGFLTDILPLAVIGFHWYDITVIKMNSKPNIILAESDGGRRM